MILAFLILLQSSGNRTLNCWLASVWELIFGSICALALCKQYSWVRIQVGENRVVFLILYNSDVHSLHLDSILSTTQLVWIFEVFLLSPESSWRQGQIKGESPRSEGSIVSHMNVSLNNFLKIKPLQYGSYWAFKPNGGVGLGPKSKATFERWPATLKR